MTFRQNIAKALKQLLTSKYNPFFSGTTIRIKEYKGSERSIIFFLMDRCGEKYGRIKVQAPYNDTRLFVWELPQDEVISLRNWQLPKFLNAAESVWLHAKGTSNSKYIAHNIIYFSSFNNETAGAGFALKEHNDKISGVLEFYAFDYYKAFAFPQSELEGIIRTAHEAWIV